MQAEAPVVTLTKLEPALSISRQVSRVRPPSPLPLTHPAPFLCCAGLAVVLVGRGWRAGSCLCCSRCVTERVGSKEDSKANSKADSKGAAKGARLQVVEVLVTD